MPAGTLVRSRNELAVRWTTEARTVRFGAAPACSCSVASDGYWDGTNCLTRTFDCRIVLRGIAIQQQRAGNLRVFEGHSTNGHGGYALDEDRPCRPKLPARNCAQSVYPGAYSTCRLSRRASPERSRACQGNGT